MDKQTMQLKKLLTDDEAVSPVIGVILMVAITVILAAVIGTFVLGLGDRVSQAQPNTNFGFSYNGQLTDTYVDTVKIEHKGGNKLNQDNIKVTIGGTVAWEAGNTKTGNGFQSNTTEWNSDSITAGATLELADADGSPATIANGDKVQVIWSSDSGQTAIIGEGTVS